METENIKKVGISTIDNPFDPITDFDNWLKYDNEKGYYTCSKLARFTNIKEGMSEFEYSKNIEKAIDRMIELDPLDIYIKIEH